MLKRRLIKYDKGMSEISLVEICHVEFLYQGMRRVVYHVYSDASPPTVLSHPFEILAVWAFSHLGKHKG